MTTLSGVIVFAALAVPVCILIYASRRRPGDVWDWTEDAYQPQRTQPQDTPRAVTRIRSKNVYWEIN